MEPGTVTGTEQEPLLELEPEPVPETAKEPVPGTRAETETDRSRFFPESGSIIDILCLGYRGLTRSLAVIPI